MNIKYAIETVNRQGFTKYLDSFGAWTDYISEAALFAEDEDARDFMIAEGLGHSAEVMEVEVN